MLREGPFVKRGKFSGRLLPKGHTTPPAPSLNIFPLLILRRFLDVFHYQNLHWTLYRFQSQPKLFLQRGEDGRPGGIRRGWVFCTMVNRGAMPTQRKVVAAGESSVIQNSDA